MQAYHTLERRFARISRLDGALGILGWDKETTMPPGAAVERGEQIATLSVIRHELLCDPGTGALLHEAEADPAALGPWQAANLREMRRAHAHATAVPPDLVEAASRAATACEMAWRQARAESDYPSLLPHLEQVLATQRATGAAKGEALGLSPYDALLDQYDPGLCQSVIDPIFADLRDGLPSLLAEVMARQAGQTPLPMPMPGPFPVEAQRRLGEQLMQAVGFDSSRGRLDVSTHPFCGGANADVRITTRYDEADFSGALMGVLHETGHAIYEQNRPADWLSQPVGQARGMTLHESQSLLIEMQACRSDDFLRFLAPLLRDAFGDHAAFEVANLQAHYRLVRPGLIRVDADEITYPAHVLVRYEIERSLFAGELSLRDLPTAFNDGMRALLGISVPDDRRGCLQDIHWFAGLWGYFPTYTLGAMTAAQLFRSACVAVPGLQDGLSRGDFAPLVGWLAETIHRRGSSTSTAELVRDATGAPLDATVYQAHLRGRYLGAVA